MSSGHLDFPHSATPSHDPAIQQRPWHVLRVRSNFERNVALHLTVRSIESYVPLYRERVKWTDRTVFTDRPLFCGYVFARFPPELRISAISAPGVVRSLSNEEQNMVSSTEIDRIRAGLTSGLLLRPHPQLAVGMRVRVRSGVFEGVEGVVKELHRKCRVILTLTGVQQPFSLELELKDLETLNDNRTGARALQQRPALGFQPLI